MPELAHGLQRRPQAPSFTNHINIGSLVFIVGVLLAVPLLVLAVFPVSVRYVVAFAGPSVFSLVLGAWLFIRLKRDDDVTHLEVNTQIGSLTVLLGWLYGFVAGAAPFVIAGYLDPLHAFFESVSGWTTTGMTMLDVAAAPEVFLFHRAFMQLGGGLGFVMVVLVFVHSKQAVNLFSAEGHPDRLAPEIRGTARIILLLYMGFVALGTVLFRVFGMPWFDAMLHSMGSLSTGGFSTHPDSIGAFNSAGIEIVALVLMVIGATNFAVLALLAWGRWRQVSRVSEVRFFVLVVAALTAVVALMLWTTGYDGRELGLVSSVHHGLFNMISALSTAGYSTLELTAMSEGLLGLFVVAMVIGGGIGSTAGGIKLQRAYILLRVLGASFKRRLLPVRVVTTAKFTRAQGRATIDDELATETTGFVLMYLAVFLVGALVLTVSADVTLAEGAFEFASTLSSAGLSVGVVTAEANAVTLVTAIVGMILGRLEIFIVLIGVYSGWRLSKAKVARAAARVAARRAGPGRVPEAVAAADSRAQEAPAVEPALASRR